MKMGMKMAADSTIPLLLLCCFAISSADSKEVCNLYAKTGADFTVPMTSALVPTDTLIWRHNNTLIYHRKKNSVILKNSVSENGSLKLTNVKMSDAGIYTPEVYSSDGINKATTAQRLCVMDPAPKPTVTIVCETISDVPHVVSTCDVKPKVKDLQFAWLQSNNVLKKESGRTLKKPIDQVGTDPISCKVSNLAGSMMSEPVTHDCIVDSFSFPDELYGINTWIFVGAGGGVVLVLIIIVIVCCICTRRRKHRRQKDEGELRLTWTNEKQQPPDQHHPHPHRPQQQQPAGHTGPRQQRSRQQRPRDPDHSNSNPRPQASPRRPLQAPKPPGQIDEEQPPPLPQPRKNAAKTQRV